MMVALQWKSLDSTSVPTPIENTLENNRDKALQFHSEYAQISSNVCLFVVLLSCVPRQQYNLFWIFCRAKLPIGSEILARKK